MKIFRIIKRLIALPFAFGLLLVTHLCFVFHRTSLFLWYGGKFEHHTRETCYDELEIDLKLKRERIKALEEHVKNQQMLMEAYFHKTQDEINNKECKGQ